MAERAFSSWDKRGLLSSCCAKASHWVVSPVVTHGALGVQASMVVVHRLQRSGSLVVHWLPRSLWDLPSPGNKSVCPALQK